MKQCLTLFFVCLIFCSSSLSAQEEVGQYLLPEFEKGVVYYKDGRQYNTVLNYNVISQEFLFKDEDQITKAFAEKELVTLVKIGDRTFLHDKNLIQEVLQIEPPILVQYRGIRKDKGKNAGYGGTSSTSAIESYSGMYSNGKYHKFEKEGEVVAVSRIVKRYQLRKNGKKKNFSSSGEFVKIYPAFKDEIKSYIKENKIDFNYPDQVVRVCNYADALK